MYRKKNRCLQATLGLPVGSISSDNGYDLGKLSKTELGDDEQLSGLRKQ